MSGLELNKIAAAILIAGLIAMISGFVADGLYHPEEAEKRGYSIAGADSADAGATAAAPAAPVDINTFMATADVAKGEAKAKMCVSCHSFESGGANKVGPNLFGIIGASHAHSGSFAYSSAMAALKGKPWDVQSMSEFLNAPAKAIPGTKMSFAGIKDPQERANVIAYLKTLK